MTTTRWTLGKFFTSTHPRELKRLSIKTVEQYLAGLGKKGWTRNGIRGEAYHLRRFFLYSEGQGWTARGIGAAIHGPRVYTQEQLSLGPAWPDVESRTENYSLTNPAGETRIIG